MVYEQLVSGDSPFALSLDPLENKNLIHEFRLCPENTTKIMFRNDGNIPKLPKLEIGRCRFSNHCFDGIQKPGMTTEEFNFLTRLRDRFNNL